MRISRLIFATLLVLAISTTFVFVKGIDRGLSFQILNDSSQAVSVTVTRRNKSRDLGTIEAGSRISLMASDEALMVFAVRSADGREIESQPIYITSGVVVNISISQDSVDIKHDVDT